MVASPKDAGSRLPRDLLPAAALALLVLVGLLLAAQRIPGADEDLFRYVGYAWSQGDLPYRDAFENKPPGIFLIWTGVWLAAAGSEVVARLSGVAATCLAAVLVARVAGRLWGSAWSLLAGLCFLGGMALPTLGYPFADTETFGVLLSITGLALVLPVDGKLPAGRALAAGLLYGAALLFKPVFLIDVAAALGLLAFTARIRLRPAAFFALAAGVLTPFLITLLCFAAWGAADDYLSTAFGSLARNFAPPVARVKAMYAGAAKFLQPATVVLIVLAATTAAVHCRSRSSALVVVVVAWTGAIGGLIFLQGLFSGHQFKQVLTPLALLAPGALARLEAGVQDAEARRVVGRLTGCLAGVALFFTAFQVYQDPVLALARHIRREAEAPPERGPLAANPSGPTGSETTRAPGPPTFSSPEDAVDRLTSAGDRIWCYPEGGPYVETRRLSGARHFNHNFLEFEDAQAETLHALARGRARLVLVDWSVPDRRPTHRIFEADLRELLASRFAERGRAGPWHVYEFQTSSRTEAGAGEPAGRSRKSRAQSSQSSIAQIRQAQNL
jgi:hypothetical protein